MQSDHQNNSAGCGRKHFLLQKSIGIESDSIFHLRQITIKEQKSAPVVGATVTHPSINHSSGLGAVPNTGEKLIKLILWESDKLTESGLSAPKPFPFPCIFRIAQGVLFGLLLSYLIPAV